MKVLKWQLHLVMVTWIIAATMQAQTASTPAQNTPGDQPISSQASTSQKQSGSDATQAASVQTIPNVDENNKVLSAKNAPGAQDTAAPSSTNLNVEPQDPPRFSPIGEINNRLPKWLRFDVEYRARLEQGLTGKLFQPNSADTYFLNRFRFGATVHPSNWLTFYAQGVDARAFYKNPPETNGFYDRFDLSLAYMEIGDTEKGTLALRAGRQGFYFGEGRLVAESL